MNTRLRNLFEKLESSRTGLLQEWQGLNMEQLSFQPAADSWSLMGVAGHLMKAEYLSNKYVRKKLQYPDSLKRAGIVSKVRAGAIGLVFKTGYKWNVPNDMLRPDTFASLEQLATEWDQIREDLRSTLLGIPPDFLEMQLFKHPLAGRMNLYQMLTFMQDHFDHHLKQVERIRKHPGFPAGTVKKS